LAATFIALLAGVSAVLVMIGGLNVVLGLGSMIFPSTLAEGFPAIGWASPNAARIIAVGGGVTALTVGLMLGRVTLVYLRRSSPMTAELTD
jgi:hypothetical protein